MFEVSITKFIATAQSNVKCKLSNPSLEHYFKSKSKTLIQNNLLHLPQYLNIGSPHYRSLASPPSPIIRGQKKHCMTYPTSYQYIKSI